MNYSEFACKDQDAIYFDESLNKGFFDDTGLIINSNAFMRLRNKMQAYPFLENSHITTRMTHVILVSYISRKIGRGLSLNEDLIEAGALAHDLGHVPFGHEGEVFFEELSNKYLGKRFKHNLYSAKILMFLENKGKGLNVSMQVIDAALCHNGEALQGFLEPKIKTKDQFLKEYYDSYINGEIYQGLMPMTLEGCVVRISDFISYIGRDLDDAERYGVFNWERIPKDIKDILGYSREEMVNTFIRDIVNNSKGMPYIHLSRELDEARKELYKISFKETYKCDKKMKYLEKIDYIINGLFEIYLSDLKRGNPSIICDYYKSMEGFYQDKPREEVVLDYISGMSEDFLMSNFEKERARIRKL